MVRPLSFESKGACMKRTALGRLAAASLLLVATAEASAAVTVDLSGTTHAGSNAVIPGVPITGSFTFDETAAVAGFSNSTMANFSAPGSAQFTVNGQTYTYSTLTDIFLDSSNGAIALGFANGANVLTLITFAPNINLSSVPTAGQLTGRFFLDACTPASGTTCAANDATRIYAEVNNPAPEPATWAMMLLGFVAIGFAMRRQRKVALTQPA